MQSEIQKMSDRELSRAIASEVWGWTIMDKPGWEDVEYGGEVFDPAESFALIKRAIEAGVGFNRNIERTLWRATWGNHFIAECPEFARCVAEAALVVAREGRMRSEERRAINMNDGMYKGCEYRAYVRDYASWFGKRRWLFGIERKYVVWDFFVSEHGFKSREKAVAAAHKWLDGIETPPKRDYVGAKP